MNDWRSWLGSNETRTLVKTLKEETTDLIDEMTNGSHLQEKSIEKIALDFAYTSGVLDGMRRAIKTIEEIENDD